jgi:hypothetical protein
MRIYLKEKVAAPVYTIEINCRGSSAALTTRHPSLSTEADTKIRRPVALALSVYFTWEIKATEIVCLFV